MFRIAALSATQQAPKQVELSETKHRKRRQILYDVVQSEAIVRAQMFKCKCASNCMAQFSSEDIKSIRTERTQWNANEETTRRYVTLHGHVLQKGKIMLPFQNKLICIATYCAVLGANQSTGLNVLCLHSTHKLLTAFPTIVISVYNQLKKIQKGAGCIQVGRPRVDCNHPLRSLVTEKVYVWLVSDFLPGHGDSGEYGVL
jgi:hypothetical protein